MRMIKNIPTQFAKAILFLVAIYTSANVNAQTYNDGAMNLKMTVGYSYVNSIAFPNELNNYEFRWRWWGADNANLDGLGWVGGTAIGVNTQNVGWINPQDVRPFLSPPQKKCVVICFGDFCFISSLILSVKESDK